MASLLEALLRREVPKRLGTVGDAAKVRRHRFFRGRDWARACWHAATRRSSRRSSTTSVEKPTRPTSTPPSPTSPCSPRGADPTQALTLAPTLGGPSPPPPCPVSTTRPRAPSPAGTLLARPNPCKYVSAAPGVGHNFLLQVQSVECRTYSEYRVALVSAVLVPVTSWFHASSCRRSCWAARPAVAHHRLSSWQQVQVRYGPLFAQARYPLSSSSPSLASSRLSLVPPSPIQL